MVAVATRPAAAADAGMQRASSATRQPVGGAWGGGGPGGNDMAGGATGKSWMTRPDSDALPGNDCGGLVAVHDRPGGGGEDVELAPRYPCDPIGVGT